ncbi:MAG: hypothetical protein V3U13_01785 [Gemmatimonadota bacterium]
MAGQRAGSRDGIRHPHLSSVLLAVICVGRLNAQSLDEPANTALPVLEPAARQVAKLNVPIHPTVAASPDGRFFAALQTRPDPILWIVPTDGGEPFAFRKRWAIYRPRWAPSGNRIGFIAAIGPPRIWTVEVDPESGRPIDPPRMLIRTNANAFAFSPDGERVALVSSRSTAAGASEIHIVDWESRRYRVLPRESGMVYWLDWSPDGKSIYYGVTPSESTEDTAHRVVRADVVSGATETVLRVGEFLGLSADGTQLLYRPAEPDPAGTEVLELATAGGEPLMRLVIPAGPTPRWGADPTSLLQIRAEGAGSAVLQILLCREHDPEAR